MATVTLSESRIVQVPVEEAFDRVLPHPLPEIFRRRRLAIPPIKEVRDQDGEWGTVGQTRTIATSDGGTLRETLTSVERPQSFGYTISQVRGPMKPLIVSAEGRWGFESAGTGTRITWTWVLTPTAPGRLVMPAFGAMWHGYARQALEEVEAILLG
ncbi:MAG: SRPBCC family protein [Nocardioides sp.]|uniref:SRPBCC family protein n=1 Tax=Nocardioides sp. TaxID=35761 RepID=UPI0032661E2C